MLHHTEWGTLCGTVTGCLVDNATVHNYVASAPRSSGGAVGFSNGGNTAYTNVTNTKMILQAANTSATDNWLIGDADGNNCVCQGYIVGKQKNGVIKSVGGGKASGCSAEVIDTDFDCGNLFCFGAAHYDCYFNGNFKNDWGYAGRIFGSCSVS